MRWYLPLITLAAIGCPREAEVTGNFRGIDGEVNIYRAAVGEKTVEVSFPFERWDGKGEVNLVDIGGDRTYESGSRVFSSRPPIDDGKPHPNFEHLSREEIASASSHANFVRNSVLDEHDLTEEPIKRTVTEVYWRVEEKR